MQRCRLGGVDIRALGVCFVTIRCSVLWLCSLHTFCQSKGRQKKQKDNYDLCILFCPRLCFSLDDLEEWGYQIFIFETFDIG